MGSVGPNLRVRTRLHFCPVRARPTPPTRSRFCGRCRQAGHERSEPSGLSCSTVGWRASAADRSNDQIGRALGRFLLEDIRKDWEVGVVNDRLPLASRYRTLVTTDRPSIHTEHELNEGAGIGMSLVRSLLARQPLLNSLSSPGALSPGFSSNGERTGEVCSALGVH